MGVIIIGSAGSGTKAAIERVLKGDVSVLDVVYIDECTDLNFAQVQEKYIRKIAEAFSYSEVVCGNAKEAFVKFAEYMNDFKKKESFEVHPSKYISKPKNNFRTR